MRRLFSVLAVLVWLQISILQTFGQNFTGDARKIGMGGVGDAEDIASRMIEARRTYRTFVIPLGLFQVIQDRNYFDPGDERFDPVRAIEDLSNPLHFTVGRGENDYGFVGDLVNARLSRDLNRYRGWVPERQIVAEGLGAPSFGYTFRVTGGGVEEPFNGLYFGAGPYLSMNTRFNIDDQFREILASETDVYLPNRTLLISDQSFGQAALALTAGYRGRIGLPGSLGSIFDDRNGIYFAGNYHYLHGFRYDAADVQVRFDTDSQGLLTVNPATVPLTVTHPYSSSGRGFAVDLGVAMVIDSWQFGLGATGIANRMEWDEVRLERFTLQSVINGGGFIEQNFTPSSSSIRTELPITYSAGGGYDSGEWAALAQVSHGFQGNNFHGGIERRLGAIDVRGGLRYSRERWNPAGGVGLNVTSRFSIDVAAFDSVTNIEGDRKLALALSLRFNR